MFKDNLKVLKFSTVLHVFCKTLVLYSNKALFSKICSTQKNKPALPRNTNR